MEDSFDVINSSGTKPLAAYLFTNKEKLKEKFVATVSAGGLVVNDTTVHVIILLTHIINVDTCMHYYYLYPHISTFKSGGKLHV